MVSDAVRQIVDRVLREQLAEIGYDSAEVREDVDHDGDDILRIRINYHKVGDSIDPSPTFSLARHLRSELRKMGDDRFPHFTHVFPEDQNLKVA